jgi:flavin reductase (DIM6/NTAB) family NADH-FMN oxidoreductase RutF
LDDEAIAAAAFTLGALRTFPTAITTRSGARTNGCIVLSGGSGSVIPEAPRLTVGLMSSNHSHELVTESGILAMHLLSAEPDQLDRSLDILMALAGSSGADGDKLANLATTEGDTGVPILTDALSVVEATVVNSMVCEDQTIFLADVVQARRLRKGARLDVGTAWAALPDAWTTHYDGRLQAEIAIARRDRGI